MIKLEDLSDDPTPEQIRQLDRASLDLIPYERMRWVCQGKGCKNSTGLRDYGIFPFYMLERGSKRSLARPDLYWRNIETHFHLCGRHWLAYDRLMKNYEWSKVFFKLCDADKDTVVRAAK